MPELRAEIDRIDAELVALLARRVACIDRAVVLKRRAGLPARIEPRVEEVARNARDVAAEWGLEPGGGRGALAEDHRMVDRPRGGRARRGRRSMPILSPTGITGRVVWLGLVRDRAASLRSATVERVEARFEGFVGESHSGLTRPACSRVAALHPKGTPSATAGR